MLPTVDSRVFAIQGGNRRLPEALLRNASVVMLTGAAVTKISTDESGLFHVGLADSSQVWQTSAPPPPPPPRVPARGRPVGNGAHAYAHSS